MAEASLQFLGEQITRVQTELRDLRGLRSDIVHLRADVSDRMDSVHQRVDNLERSIDARLDQIGEQMATNLEVVLAAITAEK